jgi:uncharacterized membrane protein YdbT with pleckstrin-like domain
MATTGPILRRRRSYRGFLGLYILAGIVAAAIWIGGYEYLRTNLDPMIIGAVGLAPLLIAFVWAVVARSSIEYRVHSESIEMESGVVSRRIDNLQLFRVRDLNLNQSLFGRLVGVGDVTVTSTDQSTPRLVLQGIDDPRAVYEKLRELVAASQATRRTMIVEEEPPPPTHS